jgi:hypothetical protein
MPAMTEGMGTFHPALISNNLGRESMFIGNLFCKVSFLDTQEFPKLVRHISLLKTGYSK